MSSRMKMGYIEVETGQDCNIFPPNTLIRGQVYHYSEILRETVVGGWDPESSDNVVPTCYQATMKVSRTIGFASCAHVHSKLVLGTFETG